MEKIKYKYEVRGGGDVLMGSGNLLEMAACISRQAQIIYGRMKDQDPKSARAFQAAIIALLTDPTSPTWTDRAEAKEGVGLFYMENKNRGGGV